MPSFNGPGFFLVDKQHKRSYTVIMLEKMLEQYQTMTLDEIYHEIERLESDDNLNEPQKNTCWQELNRILNCRHNQDNPDMPC